MDYYDDNSMLADVLVIHNDFIVPCWILLVINIVLSVWWMILHLFTASDKKTIQNQKRLKIFTFVFIGLMLFMFVRACIRMIVARAEHPEYVLGGGEMFWYSLFLIAAFILASNWWQALMINISPGEYTQFQLERNMNFVNIAFGFAVAIFFVFMDTEGSTFRERFMDFADKVGDFRGYAADKFDERLGRLARRRGVIRPRKRNIVERTFGLNKGEEYMEEGPPPQRQQRAARWRGDQPQQEPGFWEKYNPFGGRKQQQPPPRAPMAPQRPPPLPQQQQAPPLPPPPPPLPPRVAPQPPPQKGYLDDTKKGLGQLWTGLKNVVGGTTKGAVRATGDMINKPARAMQRGRQRIGNVVQGAQQGWQEDLPQQQQAWSKAQKQYESYPDDYL